MITIGKLAALFGISHHQIRYYEAKHIFSASAVDDNGYRMYDLDGVYRLAQILLLRELELSVAQIKAVQGAYSAQEYQQLLSEKIDGIEAMIAKLTRTKEQLTRQLLTNQQELEERVKLPAFELEVLVTLKLTEKLTAEMLVNMPGMERLLTESIYYVFTEEGYHICAKAQEGAQAMLSFATATYQVHTAYIDSEEEAEQRLITLSNKYQRYPEFVLENHGLTTDQVSKVSTASFFSLAHEGASE